MSEQEFVRRTQALRMRLYRTAYAYLGGEAAALDAVDEAVYEFYQKVGRTAGGLPPEKVMADALFKLAGELSLQALHEKSKKK